MIKTFLLLSILLTTQVFAQDDTELEIEYANFEEELKALEDNQMKNADAVTDEVVTVQAAPEKEAVVIEEKVPETKKKSEEKTRRVRSR